MKAFAKSGISYIFLLDAGKQFKEYGIRGIPAAFFIDQDERVLYRDAGFGRGKEKRMERKVKELSGL